MDREARVLQTQFNDMVKRFATALVELTLPQNEGEETMYVNINGVRCRTAPEVLAAQKTSKQ